MHVSLDLSTNNSSILPHGYFIKSTDCEYVDLFRAILTGLVRTYPQHEGVFAYRGQLCPHCFCSSQCLHAEEAVLPLSSLHNQVKSKYGSKYQGHLKYSVVLPCKVMVTLIL